MLKTAATGARVNAYLTKGPAKNICGGPIGIKAQLTQFYKQIIIEP